MAIRELKHNEKATATFGILSIEEMPTKAGGVYLNLTLSDKEHILYEGVKVWNSTKEQFKAEKGSVIEAQILAKEYKGQMGYEIISFRPVDLPITDYVHASKYNPEELYQMVLKALAGLHDTGYKSLTMYLYEKHHDKILSWSAAKSMHHNYKGGWIEHVSRMVLHAQMMTNLYPILNKELLVCATALHDIGKLVEMETDELGAAEYTVTGSLLGHPYIGAKIVEDAFRELYPENDLEYILPLIHCIVAHSGKMEWGAVVKPIMAEAYALFLIDMFDARMKNFEEALEPLAAGEITQSFQKALGSLAYKAPERQPLVPEAN